jgi:hypothetical protein
MKAIAVLGSVLSSAWLPMGNSAIIPSKFSAGTQK